MASNIPSPDLQSKDQYRNRRTMAWIGFIYVLGGTVLLVGYGLSSDATAARIESMRFVIGSGYGVCISIVLAYFGATTSTDIWGKK